jgi:hypothetical protein
MSPRYRVACTDIQVYNIEVEADSESEAVAKANAEVAEYGRPASCLRDGYEHVYLIEEPEPAPSDQRSSPPSSPETPNP